MLQPRGGHLSSRRNTFTCCTVIDSSVTEIYASAHYTSKHVLRCYYCCPLRETPTSIASQCSQRFLLSCMRVSLFSSICACESSSETMATVTCFLSCSCSAVALLDLVHQGVLLQVNTWQFLSGSFLGASLYLLMLCIAPVLSWGFTPRKRPDPLGNKTTGGENRSSSSTAGQSPASGAKRSKLSELRVPEASKSQSQAGRKPNNADIELCIYKYSDEAADYISSFSPGEALYAILLRHEAYPSVDSDVLNGLGDWLQAEHAQDVSFPENLRALREQEHIEFVLTSTQARPGQTVNPQGMPWQNWRSVFYVAGTSQRLQEVVELLHNFFVHRVTNPRRTDRSPWPGMPWNRYASTCTRSVMWSYATWTRPTRALPSLYMLPRPTFLCQFFLLHRPLAAPWRAALMFTVSGSLQQVFRSSRVRIFACSQRRTGTWMI